jgi:hypothetical protein
MTIQCLLLMFQQINSSLCVDPSKLARPRQLQKKRQMNPNPAGQRGGDQGGGPDDSGQVGLHIRSIPRGSR